MLSIRVSDRIYFDPKKISKPDLRAVKAAFKYRNQQYYTLKALKKPTWNTPEWISTFRNHSPEQASIPRGGINKLFEICGKLSSANQTQVVEALKPFEFDPAFQFRSYQEAAVEAIEQHDTCLIKGAAGSGKTEIVLGGIAALNQKSLIVVHTRQLFDQWVKRIEKRLGIPVKQIGKIKGGAKKTIGDQITVAMIQSARKMVDELKDKFGLVAADECHHAPASTFYEFLDQLPCRHRIGVSATIKRRDLKHYLTHDLFGAIECIVDREELEDLGYLQEVECLVVPTEFYFDYRNIDAQTTLREMGIEEGDPDYPQLSENGWTQYLNESAKDRDKNNLIFNCAKLELEQGNRCLVFVKRIEQCHQWEEAMGKLGIPVAILWSGKSKQYEKECLVKLRSGEIKLAVGTVLEEGIDIPAMECGFVTWRTAQHSGLLEQLAGRLARKAQDKEGARLYYFHDHKITAFRDDVKRLKKAFRKVKTIKRAKKKAA